MPTMSYYPAVYAAEAALNLRELAAAGNMHVTGPIIAELRDAATAMRQVLDQLATARAGHNDPAALAAADDLHQAGTALDAVAAGLTRAAQTAEQSSTRRSERKATAARHARRPEPESSWFTAPATGAERERGLSL